MGIMVATYCGITGDGFDETLVKTNFLKDTQIFALFTLIIGLEHVTALKEEPKVNARAQNAFG